MTLPRLVIRDITMTVDIDHQTKSQTPGSVRVKARAILVQTRSEPRCGSMNMFPHHGRPKKYGHGWYPVTHQDRVIIIVMIITRTETKVRKIGPKGASRGMLPPRGEGRWIVSGITLTLHDKPRDGSHREKHVTPPYPLKAVATVVIRTTAIMSGSPRKRAK